MQTSGRQYHFISTTLPPPHLLSLLPPLVRVGEEGEAEILCCCHLGIPWMGVGEGVQIARGRMEGDETGQVWSVLVEAVLAWKWYVYTNVWLHVNKESMLRGNRKLCRQ